MILPHHLPLLLSNLPIPASTRRHDDDALAGTHRGSIFGPEVDLSIFDFSSFLFFSVVRNDGFLSPLLNTSDPEIFPASSVFAAVEAPGVVYASFRQDGDLDGDSEFDVADHAVAAAVLAITARVGAEAEFAQDDGVAAFEDLSVGDTCVGHVDVDAGGAGPRWAGTGTASDGFVVAEAFLLGVGGGGGGTNIATEAEGEVVAVALAGGTGFEAPEYDVCYSLRLYLGVKGQ